MLLIAFLGGILTILSPCILPVVPFLFAAADRIACVAMSVVAHMTYAQRIDLSGTFLAADDFKATPEGHTGGSLNMVPAFVGYLLANALTGTTRGWLMGQGHCVAAIDALNGAGTMVYSLSDTAANLAAAELRLSEADMAAIATLERGERVANPGFAPRWD